MCQLNVYRGNPRDGCYFHQESNDKRMKVNDDQGGAVASWLARSSAPDSSPGRGHCVVFLGKALYSHGASLHRGV